MPFSRDSAYDSPDSLSGITPALASDGVDRLTFGGNLIPTGTDSYRLAITQARAAAQNAAD